MHYKPIMEPFTFPVRIIDTEKQKAVYLGNKESRKCMFCGKAKGEVTFKKDAHVIPASLGNRILFNYNECDDCNEHHFGVHENELANYLMLDRVFIGARKRVGLPKYRPNQKGGNSMEHLPDSNTVSIKLDDLEDRFEIINDDESKNIIFKINDPLPYRPVDICKSLTHMVWPFLSKDRRDNLKHIPQWLLGEFDILPLYLDVAFVPGNGFSKVILECWESKDGNFPLMVRFTFGLKILTFYIPASKSLSKAPIRNEIYIQIPEHIEELSVDGLKINENKRLRPDYLTYTMSYNSAEELDLEKDDSRK